MRPTARTKYADSGGLSIAYQDVGTGRPVLWVPGFVSHIELMWDAGLRRARGASGALLRA